MSTDTSQALLVKKITIRNIVVSNVHQTLRTIIKHLSDIATKMAYTSLEYMIESKINSDSVTGEYSIELKNTMLKEINQFKDYMEHYPLSGFDLYEF